MKFKARDSEKAPCWKCGEFHDESQLTKEAAKPLETAKGEVEVFVDLCPDCLKKGNEVQGIVDRLKKEQLGSKRKEKAAKKVLEDLEDLMSRVSQKPLKNTRGY